MEKTNKKLTTFEAICIVAGYGLGSGVMALPLFVAKTGVIWGLVMVILAFVVSLFLHLMIAEVSINSKSDQLIGSFQKFLFNGKYAKVFTWIFFILMGLNLVSNLAVYLAGAGEVIASMTGMDQYLGIALFYLVAAGVVFFGLKVIGISEKIAIIAVGIILAILVGFTFAMPLSALPIEFSGVLDAIALFGKIMFVFIAFFSVPQVVKGLEGDVKKVKTAVFGGLAINLVISIVICVCTLLVSPELSDNGIAIIDWVKNMPLWVQLLGSIFTLLAFVTTFWSLSLALGDIIKEQLKWKSFICWALATLPSLVLVLVSKMFGFGFLDFMSIAGGVIAILIVVLLVPVYRASLKEGGAPILNKYGNTGTLVFVVLGYVMMIVGSVLAL